MGKDEVDVVVLGGGPAGCAAAIELARLGCSVVVIERSSYDAPRIGETLPPMSRTLLEDLGAWDRFLQDGHQPAFGICSAWGQADLNENDFIFNPYGHGWHIDRMRFDRMLALLTEETGAKVWRGVQVVAWTKESSDAWEIELGAPAGIHHYRTRFVIDATGRAASFARKQGARRIVSDRLIGVAGFLSSSAIPLQDSRTLLEAVEHGWWYSALLPNAQRVFAYMTDADLYAQCNRSTGSTWQGQLQRAQHTRARAKDYSVDTQPFVFAANSSRLDSAVGCNWLAVGDAAMAFDPLSSQGVCHALQSGRQASRAIQDHWKGDETALPIYARAIEEGFDHFLRTRAQYYGRERRWPQSAFWRRRQTGLAMRD
jgi:flavin-dependent dehydrogenase